MSLSVKIEILVKGFYFITFSCLQYLVMYLHKFENYDKIAQKFSTLD